MPAMPKLLADLVVPRFARRAKVTRIDRLAPKLCRACFAGKDLVDLDFHAGQEIELRVDATAFRHYTPSAYNPVLGTMEVVFYLHGRGPGSRWADELRVGQDVGVLGPGGRLRLSDAGTHVMLGDETCLGLFAALAEAVPITRNLLGAVELAPGHEHWPQLLGVGLDAVTRTTPGAALRGWLDRAALDPQRDTTIYIVGHAGSISTLRDALRARGWSRGALRTKAYWADGKRGL